ncbi:hypothetical protein ACQY0O_006339 [Thecaphora frezii]
MAKLPQQKSTKPASHRSRPPPHQTKPRKRKYNQRHLDDQKRQDVDRDVVHVLSHAAHETQQDKRQPNPFAYPTPSIKQQRQTAKQMDQTLEAFDLLMKAV